jgi:ABC-type nitrate/sulfonate/bicarbonate transport system substrate-binding protein
MSVKSARREIPLKKTLFCTAVFCVLPIRAQLQSIVINYPAKAPANWPIFVAKEGGYYQKYGLDAKLVFAATGTDHQGTGGGHQTVL